LIITLFIAIRGKTWEKLMALSSLNVKISVTVLLLAYTMGSSFIADVAVLYTMAGGAGIVLMAVFLLGRELG